MSRRITALALIATVIVAGVAEAKAKKAAAEEAPAVRLYREGMAAYEEGRYEEALAAFTESYNLSSEPGLLYNLAVCSEKTGRTEKAIAYYELYLEENGDAEDAADVKVRLEALRKPPEETPPPPAQEEPVAPAAQAPPASTSADLRAIDAPEAGKAPVGPAIVVGTGGLVLAAGLLTAISAYKKYGDLEGSCSPDCTDSQLERTKNTALAADILMISGGVAVAAGAIWWIVTARKEGPEASVEVRGAPVATSNGGGVLIEGRF